MAKQWRALLAGEDWRMNGMTATGTPVIVTYAFTPPERLKSDEAPADGSLMASVRSAAAELSSTAGVKLVEVGPSADAMVDVAYNADGTGWSWGTYPVVTADWPNTRGAISITDVLLDYDPGSVGYQIVLHELGHALGLKHPHEGDPVFATALDDTSHTVMSYNNEGDTKAQYQPLDVAALEYLYGPADGLDGVRLTFDDGSDTLLVRGTADADTLIGVNGRAILKGTGGDDTLLGRGSGDTLDGGAGNDSLDGLSGSDLAFGRGGDDLLIGGEGRDTLKGASGSDTVAGGGGNDVLFGGKGDDLLVGGGRSDALSGGAEDDLARGGEGADTLFGGAGDDRLQGGEGPDVFRADAKSDDVVLDFDVYDGDTLDITAFSYTELEIGEHVAERGDDFVIDGGKGTLTLEGFVKLGIDDMSFLF